jgi:hypothetical protein
MLVTSVILILFLTIAYASLPPQSGENQGIRVSADLDCFFPQDPVLMQFMNEDVWKLYMRDKVRSNVVKALSSDPGLYALCKPNDLDMIVNRLSDNLNDIFFGPNDLSRIVNRLREIING